jgi:hypothetical protein
MENPRDVGGARISAHQLVAMSVIWRGSDEWGAFSRFLSPTLGAGCSIWVKSEQRRLM